MSPSTFIIGTHVGRPGLAIAAADLGAALDAACRLRERAEPWGGEDVGAWAVPNTPENAARFLAAPANAAGAASHA